MGKKKQQSVGSSPERAMTRFKRKLAGLGGPSARDAQETGLDAGKLIRDLGQEDAESKPKILQNQALEWTEIMRTLASVATALWRVRSKLAIESLPELPHELRHLPRHVQAAWDALETCHIQVQDHKDERYVPGMAVNPITFQPTPGLATEIICETIKPSVFYRDILIQRADVIVAQPLDNTGHEIEPEPLTGDDPQSNRAKETELD